ncbi:hypothetical protein ACTXT7_004524 [Hymenolepis weldensis]
MRTMQNGFMDNSHHSDYLEKCINTLTVVSTPMQLATNTSPLALISIDLPTSDIADLHVDHISNYYLDHARAWKENLASAA